MLRTMRSYGCRNYTLSPGWTREEVSTLRLALMKYGVGQWNKILESGCLPVG